MLTSKDTSTRPERGYHCLYTPDMKQLILIAEDDEDLCHLLEIHIRSKGYQTIIVQSIQETQSCLTSQSPSMVLLDNNLNDGRAMDYVEKLKAISPGLPIVLMTADFIQDLRQSQHYTCLDGVLLKPFTPESLNKVLESVA
jgi:DNA-binding NtrC family response regulator